MLSVLKKMKNCTTQFAKANYLPAKLAMPATRKLDIKIRSWTNTNDPSTTCGSTQKPPNSTAWVAKQGTCCCSEVPWHCPHGARKVLIIRMGFSGHMIFMMMQVCFNKTPLPTSPLKQFWVNFYFHHQFIECLPCTPKKCLKKEFNLEPSFLRKEELRKKTTHKHPWLPLTKNVRTFDNHKFGCAIEAQSS